MKGIHAIVFDLDGTLVDSAGDIMSALNHALQAAGRAPITDRAGRAIISLGLERMVELALDIGGGAPGAAETTEIKRCAIDYYESHLLDCTRSYAGTESMLANFRSSGIRLGICTNKLLKPACRVLDSLGLEEYFSVVIGRDSTAHQKPHPAPLLAALKSLQVTADEAVMIGDSRVDVECARASGVPVVVMRHGYGEVCPEMLGADCIVDHFSRLPDAISRSFGLVAGSTKAG